MTSFKPLKVISFSIINAVVVYLIPLTISFEAWFLLSLLIVNAILINFVYFTNKFYAMKWILPGMIFMISFVVFPAVYNTFVSFTNWSTGHILNKTQAIQILENRTYTPEDQKGFEFDIYVMQDENFDFYFFANISDEEMYFGKAVTQNEISNASPASHEPSIFKDGKVTPPKDLKLLSGKDQIANSSTLQDLSLKIDSSTRAKLYKISVFGASTGRLFSTSQLYTYSEIDDVIIDNSTNTICPRVVDNFVCNGEEIDPGWRVYVGLENYQRLFLNERIKSSLDIVTKWTFQFAVLSVFFAFSVGLFLSVTLNKEKLKFKKVYRSLYILPYAIPAFVSVLVWKGILNPDYGVVNEWLSPIYKFFDIEPVRWFLTKESSRAAVLLVNTWLGFPYMFLITTGALQSIPKELIEAARVDGASGLQAFWRITFPLLMVSVSPLLIGAFAFNFNNFTLVFLLTGGGPPVVGSEIPTGWTDLLISFTYKLAISGGRGNLFGFASSVTIVVFAIVLLISAISFRYTKRLEKIYGNF